MNYDNRGGVSAMQRKRNNGEMEGDGAFESNEGIRTCACLHMLSHCAIFKLGWIVLLPNLVIGIGMLDFILAYLH